ncbi:glycosyltransferase family 4 protein [Elizabethkingia meningoseptica]|uniref:glycosyltransferase family 4 protein n=1 Tax=Elizabethkingia meningoseptica TaxID=238 RepID=UPI0023AF48E0|nr:glycosyltransferase family 4 protein [Elizabethkingia meningoseptica]MDE5438580.1 glycosyltransferase family 4 protein [Elizabethkingia meningoseptica]MDE5507651.1 glycosyltransferase family 4 protein [Elizabethkingia meningoseptica]MDE5516499.1 glycosyltransferase family 4 protein [Elizabethkingia meningoseptica]MDE5526744.1 glycosyltransferase family 4 protein [Elizabethkingia meningoseptica]MDE5530750.1 glycosyltransferase family 4 protein [Elizabethkingia meningoseptica]
MTSHSKKNLKILMLCDYYGIGQTYQENLLSKYYRKLGHDVVILASTIENISDFIHNIYDKKKPASVDYDNETKVVRLPYNLNIFNKLRSFKGVYNILEEEKPDLIFAHDIYFNLSDAVRYKKKYNVKLIMDYHADYSNSAKNWISLNILHKLIRKTYFKGLMKYIDKIYPVVPESARFLKEVYSVPYNKMDILPLGCDFDQIQEIRENTNRLIEREKLGIKNDDIVILNGGKFNFNKKTHLAIEMLDFFKDKNIHLLLFGKADKGSEEYEAHLRRIAEGKNVHFLGWINAEDAYKFMIISDIALFPASQSVLWQQCIGAYLPVIAGDVGQQDMSYLNQNNNLIKVDFENINSHYFAQTIKEIYENRQKLIEMKNGAEKTAREYLSYNLIVMKTLRDCGFLN